MICDEGGRQRCAGRGSLRVDADPARTPDGGLVIEIGDFVWAPMSEARMLAGLGFTLGRS